jgi:hypothetical protein
MLVHVAASIFVLLTMFAISGTALYLDYVELSGRMIDRRGKSEEFERKLALSNLSYIAVFPGGTE